MLLREERRASAIGELDGPSAAGVRHRAPGAHGLHHDHRHPLIPGTGKDQHVVARVDVRHLVMVLRAGSATAAIGRQWRTRAEVGDGAAADDALSNHGCDDELNDVDVHRRFS